MQRHIKRIVILVIGWALVLLGIVGLFLPFLQGILFILLGLYLLSRESETAHRWLTKLRARHPGVDRKLREWGEGWRRRFGRKRGEDTGETD